MDFVFGLGTGAYDNRGGAGQPLCWEPLPKVLIFIRAPVPSTPVGTCLGADLGAFPLQSHHPIMLHGGPSSPHHIYPGAFCWSHAALGRLTAQKYCTPGMQISGNQSISDNILLATTSPP